MAQAAHLTTDMNDLLIGASAKVKRSTVQTNDLHAEIKALFGRSTYEIVSRIATQRDEEIWSFRLKADIPAELSVIVGEVLHNLRSALDQMACAIAMQHKGTTTGTYFPFGKTASIFEVELSRKGRKLPSEARDMIRALKPYKGGNDLLWAIHDVNRTDKHIKLVPINLRTSSNNASYLTVHSGLMLVIGSTAGEHLYLSKPRPSAEEIARLLKPTGVYRTPPGAYISFGTAGCTPEESLEFLTTTPNAKFETDMKPTFDLALHDVQGFELEPVVGVLNQMRQLTERILLTFKTRFFN